MSRSQSSIDLKQQGNQLFKNGDYVGADSLYSKACALPFYFSSL